MGGSWVFFLVPPICMLEPGPPGPPKLDEVNRNMPGKPPKLPIPPSSSSSPKKLPKGFEFPKNMRNVSFGSPLHLCQMDLVRLSDQNDCFND
ncbi:hypothetical protein BpHYR1_022038 [Brachionus plicatilis]|uniref:Uncharacterized protein n=1 Tax=Brachionus plicatilis TaxID=10195 RepID=A0A3M7SC98_BRAPC|nr:hypothetical protein BpHYR1_022038 [Brachionus plicatilis]